ncbi:MAG: TetR/AcrR family transcriptional regulator [Pseudomonadota bacterium]
MKSQAHKRSPKPPSSPQVRTARKRTSKRSRSRDPVASRQALLDAAARLFNSVGYYGTDTNRIAIAAGYTPGTFYTHFEDKRAIFLEVYKGWVNDEINAFTDIFNSKEPGKRMRLARTLLKHHEDWATFRASLKSLYFTDDVVRSARIEQRRKQMLLSATLRSPGKPERTPAQMLATMLISEALADAIADGDAEKLGVKRDDLFQILLRSI